MSNILKYLFKVNPWKTVYFNLRYFPLKIAMKMPVFIFRRTKFLILKGKITIESPISTGMVKIGPHGLGTQDMLYSRTMLELRGKLIITGKTNIGRGCKISIGSDAMLKLGKNFTITGDSTIICFKEITFGDDCLLSWDILLMDTDFHKITNDGGDIINGNKPIKVGKHVWIGCRSTILKGVTIPNNSVISANSTITKSVDEENCIIGGHGRNVEILKRGINWDL